MNVGAAAAFLHHADVIQVKLFFCGGGADCFLSAGTSSGGLKYRGTVEVFNLSDENDMDDLDVSPPLLVIDHTDNFIMVSIDVLIIFSCADLCVSV